MSQSGYYRYPTIHGNSVIFTSEDDLWQVSADGGTASRLTSNQGEVSRPILSPDGKYVAFTGTEEGESEIYLMPAAGGEETRLTYLGSSSYVVAWNHHRDTIIFASNAAQPFSRFYSLWEVDPEGGAPAKLPYGLAHSIAYGPQRGTVIGRNTGEPARWKRYRGGRVGVLWIDTQGEDEFERLVNLDSNLTSPLWIDNRIYFISDHEGVGNLYSTELDGSDLRKHTDHSEFYVRNTAADGQRIAYHASGELYLYDIHSGSTRQISVEYNSPRVQRNRKFVDSTKYLEAYNIHPAGHSLVTTHRGKSYTYANWEGAVEQIGEADGVRYQHSKWLHDGKSFITVSDVTGEEVIEIYGEDITQDPEQLHQVDCGRPLSLVSSPTDYKIALSNHRHEVMIIDVKEKTVELIDRSEYRRIRGIAWSPDGRWLAYSCAETEQTYSLKIADLNSGDIRQITPPRFRDVHPSFDPGGKYLYFLSYREFNPVYDSMYFDLNFPRGARPYLITLQKDLPSPFIPQPAAPKKKKSNSDSNQEHAYNNPTESETVEIDFEGIADRIVEFPVPEARYRQVWGVNGKVLFSSAPIQGSLDNSWSSTPSAKATIEYYDFNKQKKEVVAKNVTNFKVSRESETLVYRSKNRLRILPIEPLRKHEKSMSPGRESGWVDLGRVKVSVVPPREWQQMFREIWRLQREHFWTEDMSGVDWERVYQRYQPLLGKISSRSEFSDLVWEMQGELGTSHAYELGGDYPGSPDYKQGFLGAEFVYIPDADAYQVKNIVQGDSWKQGSDSPLRQVGSRVEEGDLLLSVNGQRVSRTKPPQMLLVNQSETEVKLTFSKPETSEPFSIETKTLKDETSARYRQWVERNRQYVSEQTEGRVGYVHIPNMGPDGYAEFHRYYLAELHKESLIVDVRFNGGGHVSQLILEKLARQRIGYDVQRWGKPEPYPAESVLGPIVAVTNELAGSDGDIFSHSFKLMELGTLIGKRTWGGVIGIFPRRRLVDKSVTTQPEFSFWFEDVGWGVENYGTDPDIEVEITPQEYADGRDPQLDKAIDVVLRQLQEHPVELPEFKNKPDLSLPG